MKWPEKRTPYNNINGSQVIIQMKPQLPLIIKMTWINWLHRLLLSPPPSKQVSVMHGGSCRQIGDLRKGTCGCSRLPLALQGSQFITLGDAIPLLIVTILRKIEEGDKHSKNVKKKKRRWIHLLTIPSLLYVKVYSISAYQILTSSASSFLDILLLLLPLIVMSSTPDRILVTASLPFSCSFIFSRKTSPSDHKLICLLQHCEKKQQSSCTSPYKQIGYWSTIDTQLNQRAPRTETLELNLAR